MTIENVTIEQIDLMKHAIRYERNKIKKGKYTAWRNHFCTDRGDEDWEHLRKLKFATILDNSGGFVCYFVSREGMNLLENLLDIKIIEED